MRHLSAADPLSCYERGRLAERLRRRAEMAATEAEEGHWMEMGRQLVSFQRAATDLLRHEPRQEHLRSALAVSLAAMKPIPRLKRGTSDAGMRAQAKHLMDLAESAEIHVSKACKV
jgi:hypothetical protein